MRKISRLRTRLNSDKKEGGGFCPPPQWFIALLVEWRSSVLPLLPRLELVPQGELHDPRVREQSAESSEGTCLIDVVRHGVHIEFRMI